MLYQQNKVPLTNELFLNPTSEYRAAPFWAWNSKLEKDELLRQVEQLKKMGFGGFHIHVRTGMATEYLGGEFLALVTACVEKARGEQMLAWLYDEDRWPSGAAGGYVTRNPAYRLRHLLLTRHSYRETSEGNGLATSTAARTGNGKLLACYDVRLGPDGSLAHYRRIGEDDTVEGFKLYAYAETALPSPWYNNQTYVDTLNPAAIREFIRVTYERYAQTVGGDFGGVVPAIFTDEPQFSHKGDLAFAYEDRDVTLPWTGDLPETYQAAYGGEDLLHSLPELLWERPDGKVSAVRYHYHDHIAERFAAAFADQCGGWCSEHGLMLTGHMMEEPTLQSQTAALGDAMRSYRAFQLPGIDMLCDRREFTTAKQAQSAARQFGRPGVISELYGVTNWDFDFRGHKLQGDWQAALGITVRVPHLSWVSMNGEAKRDYPATFGYQSPWYDQYPYIEDHFARVNTALTRGGAVCRIGVIHPVESCWLHWGPREATQSVRQQLDKNFMDLAGWLLNGQLDFDFISESLLPQQCQPSTIHGEAFPVGEMAYEVVLVPPVETLRATTLERLEIFRNAGGRVVFLGQAPTLCNAYPSDRGRKLWERSEGVPFDCIAIRSALADLRDLEIHNSSGDASEHLLYQLRQDGPDRWLFVAQGDKPANQDIPMRNPLYRIRIRGAYSATLYDTLTGDIRPIDACVENGWTVLWRPIYEHDSLLLKLSASIPQPSPVRQTRPDGKAIKEFVFPHPVPVTLHEPNVLLLDMAEYALDDEPYRLVDEILRLDNTLRRRLGWPLRGDAVAQPWVEPNTATTHTLRLRYRFNSRIPLVGAELALENAANTSVTLNGLPAGPLNGWYVDKCIGKVPLPAIVTGENCLELSLSYGKKIDVEACYLLGNFGVEVQGCRCTITEPVRELAFGDITRQALPFYGGNLTYHLEIDTAGNSLEIEASYYRSHLLGVKVDGKDAGVIAFSPYRLAVNGISPGKHRIDLTCFGTRVNTFGQLHQNDRHDQWWGPDSWRSDGSSWTWEYRFWKQGILKSPQIADICCR